MSRSVIAVSKFGLTFYGTEIEADPGTLTLADACSISSRCRDLLGSFAAEGPKSGSGKRFPKITLVDPDVVLEVTPSAAEAWDAYMEEGLPDTDPSYDNAVVSGDETFTRGRGRPRGTYGPPTAPATLLVPEWMLELVDKGRGKRARRHYFSDAVREQLKVYDEDYDSLRKNAAVGAEELERRIIRIPLELDHAVKKLAVNAEVSAAAIYRACLYGHLNDTGVIGDLFD